MKSLVIFSYFSLLWLWVLVLIVKFSNYGLINFEWNLMSWDNFLVCGWFFYIMIDYMFYLLFM